MAEFNYIILQGLPTPQEYHDLRKAAGVTPPGSEMMEEVVPKALQTSFACYVAYEREGMLNDTTPGPAQSPIAMGRLSGDGGLFLQLTDVAVHPDHQGKGIGKKIMKKLVDYVDQHASHAYVSLVAEPKGQGLYRQMGFEDVKPSMGMFRCPRIQNNAELRKMREDKALEGLRHSAT
jgi:ribosomal protein S18 acetylase RimI-like enzyme